MSDETESTPGRLTQASRQRLGPEHLEQIRARLYSRHPEDHLTAVEAAIYCGVSTRTLKRAIDAGKGPDRQKNPDVHKLPAQMFAQAYPGELPLGTLLKFRGFWALRVGGSEDSDGFLMLEGDYAGRQRVV